MLEIAWVYQICQHDNLTATWRAYLCHEEIGMESEREKKKQKKPLLDKKGLKDSGWEKMKHKVTELKAEYVNFIEVTLEH